MPNIPDDYILQSPILLILTIIFVTSLIRATIGFGNALIAMPLLVLLTDIEIATPLVGYSSVLAAAYIFFRERQNVDMRASWQLILASCVGIPIGLFLLRQTPEAIVHAILGILLIVFGSYKLTEPQLPTLQWDGYAYFAGFVAGILGGAYNTNGPPIIIYGSLREWSPEQFRATLQGYFLPASMLIFISQGIAGLWTSEVLRLFAFSLPPIILATLLGEKLYRRIPRHLFERVIHVALVVMGVLLVV